MAEETQVGSVMQFFAKPFVAAIEVTAGSISVGDTVRFRGTTTDLEQRIESMEIDRKPVTTVVAGQSVGIKVRDRVREHDKVFKLVVQP
jgi:putative protease